MNRLLVIFWVAWMVFGANRLPAAEWVQVPGVVHVHSTFSSGQYSLEQLVAKARHKGIEALVLTDHDLVVMEYGLFPLRNIIKKRVQRASILESGPQKYLAAIEHQNKRQKDVIVIAGAQSSPFYHWTGSPLKKNLVAHDYRKELLLIGLRSPEDYRGLPILHGGFSTAYVSDLLPRSISFLLSFFIGVFLVFRKGAFKIIGGFVSIFSLLLVINHHPFKSSPFDPYHGSRGIAPYQDTIDYVTQRGGMVFWAHPESRYAKGGVPIGPVTLKTEPYPDDLLASINYTGFAAMYGDTVTVTKPGRHWDRVLLQYCRGEREKPVWGIAGADFHREKKGVELDTFQTIFLVQRKAHGEVLAALANGRMYAVRKGKGPRLTLEKFLVRIPENNTVAVMGEEISAKRNRIIEGTITASDSSRYPVAVVIVKNGKIWQSFKGQTPLTFRFADADGQEAKQFYRLDVHSRLIGKLLSNPIFVKQI